MATITQTQTTQLPPAQVIAWEFIPPFNLRLERLVQQIGSSILSEQGRQDFETWKNSYLREPEPDGICFLLNILRDESERSPASTCLDFIGEATDFLEEQLPAENSPTDYYNKFLRILSEESAYNEVFIRIDTFFRDWQAEFLQNITRTQSEWEQFAERSKEKLIQLNQARKGEADQWDKEIQKLITGFNEAMVNAQNISKPIHDLSKEVAILNRRFQSVLEQTKKVLHDTAK